MKRPQVQDSQLPFFIMAIGAVASAICLKLTESETIGFSVCYGVLGISIALTTLVGHLTRRPKDKEDFVIHLITYSLGTATAAYFLTVIATIFIKIFEI